MKKRLDYIDKADLDPLGNLYKLMLLSGIHIKYLVALSWKDVDFENNIIYIHKKTKSKDNRKIVKLGNRDRYYSNQPPYVMEIFKKELEEQGEIYNISSKRLATSNKQILLARVNIGRLYPKHFTKCLHNFIYEVLNKKYGYHEVFFTSAVIAMKSECNLTSVADIVGMNRAVEMFKDPRRYDCEEDTDNNGACLYFDELYQEMLKEQQLINENVHLYI